MGEIFVTSAEGVSRTIQLILAPVVMISACAILAGGLVTRMAAINDRLRIMNRERFELLKNLAAVEFNRERLKELDFQYPDLIRRLQLCHRSVMSIYTAILAYILDMLLIAIAAFSTAGWTAWLALIDFLVATLILGSAISWTVREIRTSLKAIIFEVSHVRELQPEDLNAIQATPPSNQSVS